MQVLYAISMKPLIIGSLVFIFLTAFGFQNSLTKTATLTCTLKSDKTKYKIGELPDLRVEIVNNTGEDIYLIGSLDGSDVKWRMPYCYFTIQKPKPDTIQVARCRNMNPLRNEDFVLVKTGQKFNPYKNVDPYGFFTDYTITNNETFKNPGVYKIQFHYSTNSHDLAKFLGDRLPKADSTDSLKLSSLFNKVLKVDIVSNEIEIRFEN